jgi:hypothetical protein
MGLTLLLAAVCAFSARADRVTGAHKALQKNQPAEARKLLNKELARQPGNAGAKYVYALLFLAGDAQGPGLDSAYAYLKQAAQLFPRADAKTKRKWQKYGITDQAVAAKLAEVDSLAFTIARAAHTESAYQSFLGRFPDAPQRTEAVEKRNEIAFAKAVQSNTYESYKTFLEKYPDSRQAREAENLYELLLYEFQTGDDDLQAYELFVELYPQSPYRPRAEKRLYELYTASHTRTVYYNFTRQYPNNPYARSAWHWLYTLYHHEKPEGTFLADYPDFYDKTWLQQLEKAQPLAYFPVFDEEAQRYGFMDAEGNAVIPARYDSVASDYFCDGVKDPYLFVYQQQKLSVIDKTGRDIVPAGAEGVEPIEDDLLLVRKNGKSGIVHQGGFTVLEPEYDDVELLDETFIAVGKGDKKGLVAYTGREIMPIAFEEIRSMPEGIVAFRRNGRYALLSRDKLLAGKDTALQFAYDRVEPVRKSYLKVCADSTETILNGQLDPVLSVTGHVVPVAGGWATIRGGAWQLFDEAGKAAADTTFDEVMANEGFLAGRKGDFWALWRRDISPRLKFDYDTVTLLGNEGFAVRQGNAVFAYFRPDNFVKLGSFQKISLLRLENSAWYWLQVEDKMGRKGLYSPKGAVVLPVRYEKIIPWRGDLFCVQLNGKYGLVNQAGKLMLPPSYSALEYQKDGFIATLRNGKFGLIHMAREINIQPQYDKLLRPFDGSGNLLIAVKEGKQGLINTANEPVSEFAFDEIRYWQYGVALVKQEGRWHLYQIGDRKFLFKPIEEFSYVRQDKEEIILKVYADKKYGILSNEKGVVVDFEYDDLRNVGSEKIPFYLAENFVDDADVYLVFYLDRNGKRVHRQLFDEKRYARIICD